jgi:DNA-binding NtrC family response regulator
LVVETGVDGAAARAAVQEGDVFRIGTHPSNDLVLEDRSVSRFHCRIVRAPIGWRLEDVGSSNGTHINGLRVLGAVLPPEAIVTLGQTRIRISSSDAAAPSTNTADPCFGALIGTTRAMREVFALIEKVAASDVNCFIHGESGTGKEVVASEIVQRGPRAQAPLVVVDCGAISPSLIESELFGHVKGAFTGADRDRVGAFEAANGGTVFLDEIGELPLSVQPKLLRTLEKREIRRVGETHTRKLNVRVIAATNRDLEREVNKGGFRGDLYFRLAVVTLRIPPLRDRLEDLPHLIRAFLAALGTEDSERLFSPEIIEELARHEWPGNVRELRNHVERSIVLEGARMSLPPVSSSGTPTVAASGVDLGVPFKVAKASLIERFEQTYLHAVLEATSGNIAKAARVAGIDRMHLHRLVQKHRSRDGSPYEGDPCSEEEPRD